MLDNRSKNYSVNFRKGFADVMTQQQGTYFFLYYCIKHNIILYILHIAVREYLNPNTKALKKTSLTELKSLCLGLFEALNDKSIALQHQRKTNQ